MVAVQIRLVEQADQEEGLVIVLPLVAVEQAAKETMVEHLPHRQIKVLEVAAVELVLLV
jgi:hypothetical protein